MQSLKVIVGQAKELASSRKIYCLVSVLDDQQNELSSLKTPSVKGTSSPLWNATLAFTVGSKFEGLLVQVFERHAILSDKFLGLVRLRFNVSRLLNGEDEVDSWFTLSSPKASARVTGEIHVKVVFGDPARRKKLRMASTPSLRDEKHDTSSESDNGPDEKLVPAKSVNWGRKDNVLAKSTFVVITDDAPKENGARTKRPHQVNKKESPAQLTPPPTKPSEDAPSPRSKDARTELELVQKAIRDNAESCIADMAVDDLQNAVLTMMNRRTGKTSKVTLMIPHNVARGEFTLWTRDGAYELGRAGSILRAINKVVESFARKNGVAAVPHFSVPEEKQRGRGMLLASGWANLERDEVPEADDDDELGGELEGEDDNDMDERLAMSDVTGGRTVLMKHVEEFKALHGPSEIGVVSANNLDFTLRLALTPRNFLDTLMAEIWQVRYTQRIVIEMDITSPYYMDALKPPALHCYQTDALNLNGGGIAVASFGLQWFLQKRLETFLAKNWPPKHTHLFLDMMSYAIDKLMTCVDNCVICDKKLVFAMLKPTTCDDALCLFSHEQFGLGVDAAAEIAANPDVVDILISTTMAACVVGDVRRVTPFPQHLEVKWKDAGGQEVSRRFQQTPGPDPSAADLQQMRNLINKFPSVAEMARWRTTAELKEELDKRDHMCFPLLRWLITSARVHIAKLKPNEVISQLSSTRHQFLLLSSPPAKERKFQEEKRKHGSFWAFHGSGFGNWHSILRNGLKNLSGTALMSTGAVYGNGIYCAADSNTSIGYARGGVGWDKSMFNEGGNSNLQMLALCECVAAGYKANPYYVIPNDDHVVTRYLFLFNNRNTHRNVHATSITIPQTEYLRYNKQNF